MLAHRFPHAARFEDVRAVGAQELCKVDCITAGFPCQDISTCGYNRKDKSAVGLAGKRSGLFFEVVRILREIQPAWVVLENVAALLHSNDCADIQEVIRNLAECGYVGFWRVLDAQYFGSASRRRRIFLVAGLGRYPSIELLADAAPVEAVPSAIAPVEGSRLADAWPGYTLQACNTPARITLGGQLLVAEENGWHSMVERGRMSDDAGLCQGLDAANLAEIFGAGNAVCPHVAEWIARHLSKS
ncbi:DNA methyltransferase [Opitutaceae bacterium TAV5]|nr:DNA methyltransferase [Opitutaceae bacterium TAV5]